jgi:hypothetical protein
MPKILTDAQFITMSTATTPPAGYGSVFASGSSLFFRNDTGTVFDLTAAGSSGYYTVREYTSSASWNKPTGMYELLVICVGAGGGGGSGRCGPPSTNRLGGGGGGGGAITFVRFPTSTLPATCSITIGSAGNSGSAIGPTTTTGIVGSTGGNTTFTSGSGGGTVTFVSATGGGGGSGGGTGPGAGGVGGSTVSTIARGPWTLGGAAGGGTAGTTQGLDGVAGLLGTNGAGGGGGGGGIDATNISRVGGSGSGIFYYGVTSGSAAGGATILGSNGTNGVNNIGKSLLMVSGSDTFFGVGSAGSGAGPGGIGGNGGNYGAGGGGGGATTTGSLSGPGGRGGSGLCILVEYY